MTEQALFESLLGCLPAQLIAITRKLGLDPAYLPGPNSPLAERANAIVQLASQRGPDGLAELARALGEVAGPRPDGVGPPPPLPTAKQRCILIVAANPIDTDRLRLDHEVKLIKERLEEAEPGRSYRVEVEWAVSATELSKHLLRYQPAIVHFSGHGSPSGEIVLEDPSGKAEVVPGHALVSLFDTLKGTEAIVLNACYSQGQAEALAQVVPQVIGMAHAIGDDSALRFAGGFYRALAFGKDYATAFRLGCIEIDLAALPDVLVPHFMTHTGDRIAERTGAAAAPERIALQGAQRT